MAEDVQALTNGDMDGTETHEMNEMNDMNGPEKGRKNEGFEDEEETTPLANDSEQKQTADSGVEIDGTDSEPNGEHRGSPNPGLVDEEDGLFESTETTVDQGTDAQTEQSQSEPAEVSPPEPLKGASPEPPEVDEESLPELSTNEQPNPSDVQEDIPPPTPTDPPPPPPADPPPPTESPVKKEPVSTATPEPPSDPPNYPPPPPVETPPPDPCEPVPDTGEVDSDCNKSEDADSSTNSEDDAETESESAAVEELDTQKESAAPWPEAMPSEKEHFVYVSNLDLADEPRDEIESARSQDTVDSVEEIPYTKLEEANEETELKDTNEEEPAKEPENTGDQEDQDDNSNDTNETTEFTEELPTDQGMNNEEDLTDADDALLINDTNEETEFRDTDEEMPPPPAELIDQDDADTETATEYENHTGTLQKDGELDTPEYTPPDSPVEGQTILEMENPTYDQVEDTNDKFKFVQYEGADEETTRLESRARFKRKTDCKCLCLSMLCFLVMLLAAAFAFFVAMFLLGSLDGFLNRNDNDDVGVGAPPLARPPGAETIDAPPIDMITTMAQIELDREWDQTFDFPSSQDRNDLEIAVIAALDDTYRWGSTKYVYKDSQIDDFRRGPFGNSVFVRFISEFYDIPDAVIVSSSTPSLDEQYALAEEEMSQIVFQTLAAAIDEPTLLGRIQARQGSLELLNTEIAKP